jgi:hypothetical protein
MSDRLAGLGVLSMGLFLVGGIIDFLSSSIKGKLGEILELASQVIVALGLLMVTGCGLFFLFSYGWVLLTN